MGGTDIDKMKGGSHFDLRSLLRSEFKKRGQNATQLVFPLKAVVLKPQHNLFVYARSMVNM
ncbi:hypothetical protein QJS10_CPA10g01140 [Acorus calamus]|uniref:Uncharacterized protein n=1 Tax=Acorus calamus TaxID=4465 RepID=A0AAV9DZZ5_ACOCL|nr:hypothetical protein QJS10_CPA10g01140 [Acorus calamus]